tara:strand:+ start:376 stop:1815 length:1440 start_codon:yes stop_codon:yes gene_type:complete
MKPKIFAFLAVFSIKIMSVGPLPELDNPRDEVAVLSHYRQLPYHLRRSAQAISILFNQSINDNREQPIIDAAGKKFGNLDAYKARLNPETLGRFQVVESNDALKDQPDWVYANPYMLFFWGVLSKHARELHNLVSNMGYDRDSFLKSENGNINVQADRRAQQFWQVVGDNIDLAVDQDNPYAQLIKGLCYFDGIGLEKNIPRGLHLIKKSAKQHLVPALEFLTEFLESEEGRTYVGSSFEFIFDHKQVQLYENELAFLTNPFLKINERVEGLEEQRRPLSVIEEQDLRLMLRLLPGNMLTTDDLIGCQARLQKDLKNLFGSQQYDFSLPKSYAVVLGLSSLIAIVHLAQGADIEDGLFFALSVYSIITNLPYVVWHYRHRSPYGFSERKRQYRLRQFDADQREGAAQLLSYRLIAAAIEKGEEISTQSFVDGLVRKVGLGMEKIRYDKEKTFYQLLVPTLPQGMLNERQNPHLLGGTLV